MIRAKAAVLGAILAMAAAGVAQAQTSTPPTKREARDLARGSVGDAARSAHGLRFGEKRLGERKIRKPRADVRATAHVGARELLRRGAEEARRSSCHAARAETSEAHEKREEREESAR